MAINRESLKSRDHVEQYKARTVGHTVKATKRIPTAPKNLMKPEKLIFRKLAKILVEEELITSLDTIFLGRLAQQMYLEQSLYQRLYDEDGQLKTTTAESEIRLLNQTRTILNKMFSELPLSPKSRSSIDLPKSTGNKEEDDLYG